MLKETRLHEYLGDGVYAEYDGFAVVLKVDHHINPTDTVYLEPNMLKSLIAFAQRNEIITINDTGEVS